MSSASTTTTKRLSFIGQLWPMLRQYKTRMALALFSLVMAAGLVLALGQGLRMVIDQGFATANESVLNWSLLGMLVITAGLAAATYGRFYNVTWLGERISAELRQRIFDHLLTLDIAFFETNRVGDLSARITTDVTVLENVIGTSLSMALRNILMLIGGLILLALTSAKLLVIVLVGVPVVIVPIIFYARRVRALARRSQDQLAEVSAETAETLGAVRTIKAFAEESAASHAFRRENESAFDTARDRFSMRGKLVATIIFLVFGAIGVILWVGGHDVLTGRITSGQLSAFIFYAVLVAGATAAITEVLSELDRASGATGRIFELLAMRPVVQSPLSPTALPRPAQGALTFNGISFAYPSAADNGVLQNISFTVKPGEKVALVGPSGAGKTTLFNLLLRFYDPASGSITFDGVDIRNASLHELRHSMAIVPQDPVLFSSSIRDNLRFSRADATDEQLVQAASRAQALEFIERLPEKWDTKIGERGVRLSGGQRQRLAIARALLRDPAVLLLDEATSALDAESEHLVQQALEEAMRGRTTLVIAHRLATIRAADRILVLEAGQLVDQGKHEELVAKNGLYARLAALQFVDNPAA